MILIALVSCLLFGTRETAAQSTAILFGGDDTELSPGGVISGSGSSALGGLGAAVLDTFNIYYQPLGEGDFVDNLFPDPEVYSFQMNIPEGLPDYQSQGLHGSFWDSRGRNGEGVLPWINREWREGQYYDARYNPAGEESPYGLVSDTVQWTVDYWNVDEDGEICFIHTCLAGIVEDFVYNENSGDAAALLLTLQTAYLGYGEDGEPGPGAVEYDGGAYQGFDSFRERSGLLDYPAYFFQYDGETNEGSLTPCGTKIALKDENGWIKGYFDVIQDAVDASGDGDTVLVDPGEYVENIDFSGKNIVIIGNPDDPSETIIDGDRNDSVVSFQNSESEDAVITGFTLTNGIGWFHGGYTNGGGIVLNGSSPTISHCIIKDNEVGWGGGGIFCGNSNPTVTNCLIIDNSAGHEGGGIMVHAGSNPTIDRCTFSGNVSGTWQGGGGIYLHGNSHATVSNCIIWRNFRADNEQEIWFCSGGERCELTISYTNVEGGRDGIVTNNNGDVNWGEGNIDADPLFADPDEDDFHLTEDSPCIDAGDPEYPEDPDGTRADMGVYYFHQPGRFIVVPLDFETIQEAIDAAVDGDTILVQPGVYVENIDLSGKAIVLLSLFGLDWDPNFIINTIIDGDSSGAVVTFENGEGEDTELIGFSIRNGYVDRNGGGIRCSDSSPTISDCRIYWNHVGTRGGGISCEPNAHPNIVDCDIFENSSNSGGAAIWCGENSSPLIDRCYIHHNEAGWNGAGLNMYLGCNPVISRCTFTENRADHKGGAIIVSQDCNPVIDRCVIFNNSSVDNGGGITVERNARPVIRNSLIVRNECEGMGTAIAAIENSNPVVINCTFDWAPKRGMTDLFFASASDVIILNSILYGISPLRIYFEPDSAASSILVDYSDVMGGMESVVTNGNGSVLWGDGNIDEIPIFANPMGMDYNLTWESPCVDAGSAFFIWEDDTLLNLSQDEYYSFAPDMGALESEYINRAGEISTTHPAGFILFPAFPNPFNSTTTIRYELPYSSQVSLRLYNPSGQQVTTLFEGYRRAGMHAQVFQTSYQQSGLYFLRLETQSGRRVQKIVCVK